MAALRDPRTRKLLLVLLVVVALVNLPLVHSTWTNAKVERDGVDVRARLVGSDVLGGTDDPQYWLSYQLPEDLDPAANAWPAQVERSAYDRARASRTVPVKVLRDQPAAAQVEGEVSRRAGLWSTLVIDGLLLAVVLLLWRHRLRRGGDEADQEGVAEPRT